MIYPTKPFYIISGFSPPSEGHEMGGYGFSVGLQASFAKRCIQFEIKQENINNMNEMGTAVVTRMFRTKHPRSPFAFTEVEGKPTMMLHFVQVEGNACDLGNGTVSSKQIIEMKDDRFIEYHPHNVDSVHQAYTLLSLWLKWYSVAFSCIMDKSEI